MLYCGYQGSGKSTYCRNNPLDTIDLDSSNFQKVQGWEKTYIEKALTYKNKKVFISAHRVVIEYLLKNNIEFELLAPGMNKKAWQSRLEFRYYKNPILPNLKAVNDFKENYDKDIKYYMSLENQGVKVHWLEATIVTNIGEFI